MYDIAIWTPINSKSGFGHFYRMMGLYEKLTEQNAKVTYFSNEEYLALEDVNIIKFISDDIDLIVDYFKRNYIKTIVIDNYLLNSKDIQSLNKSFNIVYFDAEFHNYNVNAIINFNPYAKKEYEKKNICTKYFLGLDYMIFRNEMSNIKSLDAQTDGVFLSIGGSDVNKITNSLLPYLPDTESYKIILGKGCSQEYYNEVLETLNTLKLKYELLQQPKNYFEILKSCKYAISSCSTTTYELVYFKKPFICINVIENQNKLTAFLSENNIITLNRNNLALITDIINSKQFKLPHNIHISSEKCLDLVNYIGELTYGTK